MVLTGGQVPELLGTPVATIWAYRYEAAAQNFVQVPVQVDERALFDLTGGRAGPVYELTYDWLGMEDGLLDTDDEIAFMARDAGDRAPDADVWVAGADDTRIGVRLMDPVRHRVARPATLRDAFTSHHRPHSIRRRCQRKPFRNGQARGRSDQLPAWRRTSLRTASTSSRSIG